VVFYTIDGRGLQTAGLTAEDNVNATNERIQQVLSSRSAELFETQQGLSYLAAETGGNCELTQPGQTIEVEGVTIAGPLNLASMGAQHASEMYARNVYNFVSLLLKDGALAFDWDDELLAKTVWPERASA